MIEFDEKVALERTAGDRKILSEVIRFTLEDIPGILDKLERSIEKRNWRITEKLAHKLKGTAGAIGAQQLCLTASNLELAAGEARQDCAQIQSSLLVAFDAFSSHPAVRHLSLLNVVDEAPTG